MAIVFTKPKRKDLYSLIVLILLIVIFLFIFFNVLSKKTALIEIKPEKIDPPQINFSNLNNPILKVLDSYEPFPELEGDFGRENPFIFPQTQTTLPKK